MNSSSAPSPSQHQCPTERDTAQQHRTGMTSGYICWPSSRKISGHLRVLIQRRLAHGLGRPGTAKDLLCELFGAPQGAGLIGPGADALGRTALTELFTRDPGTAEVVIEKQFFERLFCEAFAEARRAAGTRLRTFQLLEDAVEYIESETEPVPNGGLVPAVRSSAIIWFVAPGQHTDVVHQVLRHRRSPQVTALVWGAWAYGPTHYIGAGGAQELPPRPIELLTAQQAAAELRAFSSIREPT
ncbi:hypothetical protein [Actinomadura fibrosa]|uniref:Uncharacterized protein n=1 Tax=Actinomadura fibrosa TaxID=111802 RepID=A0ABW2XZG9_9ACTN|nr:hypothetical protein [Actinomadura fibrosa]